MSKTYIARRQKMSKLSLTRFDQDGLELFIDENTGRAFASIRATARMCGVQPSTISRWVQGVAEIKVKEAEIQAASGNQRATLIPGEILLKVLLAKNPPMAKKLLETKVVNMENLPDLSLGIKKKAPTQGVYFIQCTKTKAVKIGISNNPLRRLSALQTGYPFDLILLRVIKTPAPRKLEKLLHKKMEDFHLRGEWFDGLCYQMIA
jgi:hypothetical protein